MTKAKLIIFAMLLLTTAAFAQDPELERDYKARVEKSRLLTIELEKAVNTSPASKALAEEVFAVTGDGRDKAIVEAGKAGDKSVMPLLKVLAEYYESVYAQAALAKFGDEEYLTRIIALTGKDQKVLTRQINVRKLILFDHQRAMKRLFELLDDTELLITNAHDEIVGSTADIVIDQLSQTVKNPPHFPNGQIDYTIPAWKAWFARNKQSIE